MYLFLCLHLRIISDLFFSMLSSLCRAMASFSLRHRRHHLELWLYDLWVPKISQDTFEVLFADIIFQYLFDSSVSVWYLPFCISLVFGIYWMFSYGSHKKMFSYDSMKQRFVKPLAIFFFINFRKIIIKNILVYTGTIN